MSSSAFECSSGCESGWTLYLDYSNSLLNNIDGTGGTADPEEANSDEEDLSMLSDASSGPPHHHAANNFNKPVNVKLPKVSTTKKHKKKKMMMKKVLDNKQHRTSSQQHLPSFLHDTATSSPRFHFSTNNVAGINQQQTYTGSSMIDYSQGRGQGSSTNYFDQGRPKEHLGFY